MMVLALDLGRSPVGSTQGASDIHLGQDTTRPRNISATCPPPWIIAVIDTVTSTLKLQLDIPHYSQTCIPERCASRLGMPSTSEHPAIGSCPCSCTSTSGM